MSNDRLEPKIDKIIEDMHAVKTHLAVYNEQLKIHIKRSETLESKIEPIEEHVYMMNGALKVLGVVSAIVAIVAGLIKIFG